MPKLAAFARGHSIAFALVIPVSLVLGLNIYQLSMPHVLTGVHGLVGLDGYDDGVYLGTAVRLVNGMLPYRDYVFVHPPGITLLMTPVAAIGRVVGTRDALAISRVVTAVVTAANVVLAGLVVRHRGPIAIFVAGLALACFPLAVGADHTLLLEPYLSLFCLLGAMAMFHRGSLASPWRLVLAGSAFGFAGTVKVWAIFPVLAAVLVCVPLWKRALRPLLLGLLLGFVVPCLPFVIMAPGQFVHDVLVSQFERGTAALPITGSAIEIARGGGGVLSLGGHLLMIFGLSGLSSSVTVEFAFLLSAVVAVLVLAVYSRNARERTRMEWFVLLAAGIVVVGMCLPPEFYDDYAYFPAVFLALLFGVCASRISEILVLAASRVSGWWARGLLLAGRYGALTVVVIGAAVVLPFEVNFTTSYLGTAFDSASVVSSAIPAGACVVAETPTLTLDANRFVATSPNCPAVVDAVGMWLADDDGRSPTLNTPFPQRFASIWQHYFDRADYVVMSVPYSDYIPWTPAMTSWFSVHYQLVSSGTHTYVYRHL